jgi:DNA polymerase-3 subunit alpha
LGLKAISITDHGSISGAVEHWEACKKEKVKCILGNELYISHQPAYIKSAENRNRTHMVVWAKNLQGWKQLIKLTSQTNHPDYFYYKPRISLWNSTDQDGNKRVGLESFCDGNLMGMSGHMGSLLSDFLFADFVNDPTGYIKDLKKGYAQYKEGNTEHYRQFLRKGWLDSTCDLALKLENMFGKGNFFIELQNELDPTDKLALWIQPLIVECLREVARCTGIPATASSDPHYARKEDAEDQRLMVSVNMKETDATIEQKLSDSDNLDLMVFYGSSNFFIHSFDEMSKKFTTEELEMTNKIADMVESYDITARPYIPKFVVPEFSKDNKFLNNLKTDSDKYLMHLCLEGAKRMKPWEKSGRKKEEYWQRLQDETNIIFQFGLSDYFLVVDDICKAADNRPSDYSFDWNKNLKEGGEIYPIARGKGRGSASGCLISYFTGITGIDPVRHNLLFSRFFNAGRCSANHVSLPDIDLDFTVEGKDWILEYIRWKYGSDKVGQIITFQTMKGRAALKDVFRVKGLEGGFDLANTICNCIAQESVIADEIQQMKNDGHDDYNILTWTLDNSTEFMQHYQDKKLKPLIDQAIRCEGTKRGTGKHPSGVVITNEPLEELFPMVYDPKSKQRIVGFDLKASEKLGACKLDVLSVAILSKLDFGQKLINANN